MEKVGDGGAEAVRDWRQPQGICNADLVKLGVKRLMLECEVCQ